MEDRVWIARVYELEEAGRFDEARDLFEQNTTPEQRAKMEENFRAVAKAMERLGPDFIHRLKTRERLTLEPEAVAEIEQIMKRIRAAKRLPEDHPKRGPWMALLHMTPDQVSPIWRLLLDKADPLKSRGRPARSKIPAEHFAEMTRRVDEGEKPRLAAKAIVGNVAGAENKADHLVKLWRKTVLKSRRF